MYSRRVGQLSLNLAFAIGASVSPVRAQTVSPPVPEQRHQHGMPMPAESDQSNDMAREASGTAWLPDTTPMYAIHATRSAWQLMLHENAFVQYLHESGDRGDDQFGSINWIMGMAQRPIGEGRLALRAMFSAEPATIRGCGYPDLLASGELCDGEKIHDRQHPHDLIMELAAEYDAPLVANVRWQAYGGPAGEPALGPAAYPHRISAMSNPLAPITHHWLDSTHITFGVLTGGVYAVRWKAEASIFNGREPDEDRADLDSGALDSVSGRFWYLPTPKLALQISAGKLTEAEASEHGGPGVDVGRVTASATYHTVSRENDIWATTVAWGRNHEAGHGSNALLVETNLTLQDRDSWFGRFEAASKTAHDLALPTLDDASADAFTVAKVQGGYTRYVRGWRGFKPGVGGVLSAGFVPDALKTTYGRRVNMGFGVFFTLRPAAMMMHGSQ